MSTFRKKSSTSTDESSSSSSTGSSSSSGSSSCSGSGSSSSDSESTSTVDEKAINQSKANESAPKSQVITRRKSSEVKSAAGFKSVGSVEKVTACPLATSKLRSTNLSQRLSRNQELSSDDEVPPVKKNTKLPHNVGTSAANPRKKATAAQQHSSQSVAPSAGSEGSGGVGGGGKAPPAVVKQHHQKNFSAAVKANTNKSNSTQNQISVSTNPFKLDESTIKDNIYPHFSTVVSSDNTDNEFPINEKQDKKSVLKPIDTSIKQHTSASISSNRVRTTASKAQPKRSVSSKSANAHTIVKSSEESESESGTSSVEGSTSSSGSDHSESSNSSASQTLKKSSKPKRNLELTSEDKDDKQQETKGRKLTRSLSTRRSKNYLIRGGGSGGGAAGSETDSDVDAADVFSKFSKSPTKKLPTTVGSSKVITKKDSISNAKNRSQSPQPAAEKKCPIEGCDSSGHLSGNQDRHFLAEACPIYHNMSASECKERANERKQREEFRKKTGNVGGVQQEHSTRKSLTAEQKEFMSKIRESRARFRPSAIGTISINTEKIKVEKDCPDDDREPSLSGLVPDYDLQLFREAQAIASEKIEEELKDLPVGKGIRYITMGKYKMKVWYQSPYPDDAARLPKMYICEFCLRYQKSETGIKRHAQKCVWRHPPGDEIYRKGKLQVWQVDGKRHKQYCQHLCLLAKFFLDHKTLYYDVEPFLFYIMTLADIDGCHTVGYFSKEKNSFYNVSCILTLPPYQRKGYGRLLIDFSYLLTRVEGKIGSPEKPLSDLGLISYRSYWKDVLLDYLCNRSGSTLSIKDVSQEMAIYSYDIVSTLQALGMMKYWKGKHIVLKKQDVLDEYDERVKRRGNFPKIDDSCLRWSPFVPPQATVSP